MVTLSKIRNWGETHHPAWIDLFRIVLGIILIYKGVQIALNLNAFSQWMAESKLIASFAISFVAHVIIVIHIIGGLMITLGTNTRLACLLQIPILMTAILFVNLPARILQLYSELSLSIFVLVLLVFFLVEGDGPFSVEHNVAEEEHLHDLLNEK